MLDMMGVAAVRLGILIGRIESSTFNQNTSRRFPITSQASSKDFKRLRQLLFGASYPSNKGNLISEVNAERLERFVKRI